MNVRLKRNIGNYQETIFKVRIVKYFRLILAEFFKPQLLQF